MFDSSSSQPVEKTIKCDEIALQQRINLWKLSKCHHQHPFQPRTHRTRCEMTFISNMGTVKCGDFVFAGIWLLTLSCPLNGSNLWHRFWVYDIFLLLWKFSTILNDVIKFFLTNDTPQRKQILRARCVHSVKPRKSPLGQANSRPKTTEFRFVCARFLWYGWHTARRRRRISPV